MCCVCVCARVFIYLFISFLSFFFSFFLSSSSSFFPFGLGAVQVVWFFDWIFVVVRGGRESEVGLGRGARGRSGSLPSREVCGHREFWFALVALVDLQINGWCWR